MAVSIPVPMKKPFGKSIIKVWIIEICIIVIIMRKNATPKSVNADGASGIFA